MDFAYFHELFVKRHSKILTKAIKKQSIVITLIFAILIVLTLKNKTVAAGIMPYTSLFAILCLVMYILNRGTTVTQAMFMNCDHSMLTYRIYRTPKVILGVFKERLKTLISLNLIPALLIGGGLTLLLYLSGGVAEPIKLCHHIWIYLSHEYLFLSSLLSYVLSLQPYNVNTEMKSSTYSLVKV